MPDQKKQSPALPGRFGTMHTHWMILLRHDGFELGLVPDAGGSVALFRHEETELLRTALSRSPTDMSAFPLFPFSGRIGRGRFSWRGREVQLRPNFPPEPHAIHGQSWLAEWDTVAVTPDRALLRYVHAGDDWPWSYRAEQQFRLGPGGLTLDLSLTNLSEEPMPGGLGWHPYFPAAGAVIEADTAAVWETGTDMLPRLPRAPLPSEQLKGGVPVSRLALDTPFSTASRPVALRWPAQRRIIRLLPDESLQFLIVYTPPGSDYFCVEPVSHIPDMVNLDAPASQTGLTVLAPGETLTGQLRLELARIATGQTDASDSRTGTR